MEKDGREWVKRARAHISAVAAYHRIGGLSVIQDGNRLNSRPVSAAIEVIGAVRSR
jgi:hypothetical protein